MIDFEDDILKAEGYDFNTFIEPYPTEFFVRRKNDHDQQFMFISHRSDKDSDKKGGAYFTKFEDEDAVMKTTVGCTTGCSACLKGDLGTCLKCDETAGYFLHNYQCFVGSCPDFSFEQYDKNGNMLHMCHECHYTCRTCVGPGRHQCSSCC